ncbi:MAG TPA: hypothetical protein VHG69_09815 [Thermoleophilaceae bacterium]|nr:hypothetical protein [Thermoleophilaceae bacterium]
MDERPDPEREAPADPSGIPEPHDVLAADEFGIGTRDERYPADPTGIDEAHDVLAAEEFAMPARDERITADPAGTQESGFDPRNLVPPLLAGLFALLLLRRVRRR